MVIMSAKLSKRKLSVFAIVLVFAIVVLTLCLNHSADAPKAQNEDPQAEEQITVSNNEERIAYLENLGWQVGKDAAETQEVRIPTESSEVFDRYNKLQQSQGFDLSQYSGKTVTRYVYEIENYPNAGNDTYYATLLIYKNEVIGGDISSMAQGGIMQGLQMPA